MTLCKALYDNIFVDCDNLPPDIVDGTVYLINYDDILYVEFDGHPPSMIRTVGEHKDVKQLYLYPKKYAYTIQGKDFSVDPGYYFFERLYEDVYAHFIDIKIFDNSAETKLGLEKLPKGKYVILITYKRAGKTYVVIYGLHSGLVMNAGVRSIVNDDGVAYYVISFETDVEQSEPHMPHKFLGSIGWLMADHWILWDGWWDDSGIWIDSETWNEG